MELKTVLGNRFGDSRVKHFPQKEDAYIDILQIELESRIPLTVLMTNGMSDYKMPVSEYFKGREHNEIFFCLPSYWDLTDLENPDLNWPINMLQKLSKNVIEKQTWYAPGHTIANGNPPKEISEKMKQCFFILSDPIALEDFLQPVEINGNNVHFLAVIPVFQEDFNKKANLGYKKWMLKYRARNGNEILDHFSSPIFKKRWFFG